MFSGSHVILFSRDAAADRQFIRDVLGFGSVDAGGDWLIFELPPAELAMHPTDGQPHHELYLMCDSIERALAELAAKGVEIVEGPSEQRWGTTATIRLPSGAPLAIYEPHHPTAISKSR